MKYHIDQEVFEPSYGDGTIVEIDRQRPYPVGVKFKDKGIIWFNLTGRFVSYWHSPTLLPIEKKQDYLNLFK